MEVNRSLFKEESTRKSVRDNVQGAFRLPSTAYKAIQNAQVLKVGEEFMKDVGKKIFKL